MNIYKIQYYTDKEKQHLVTMELPAENVLDLVVLLNSTYLYVHQLNSIQSITLLKPQP